VSFAACGRESRSYHGGMSRFTIIFRALALLALASFASQALAQRLAALLPVDTFFAAGAVGLEAHHDLLDDVIAEWDRLGLNEKLQAALGADALGDEIPDAKIPAELEELDLLALIGTEVWIAASVSAFNPLPVVTVVAIVDEASGASFDAVLADMAAEPGAMTLSEGNASFVVAPVVDGFPLAAARYGDLLAASSNPDVLRSVLRQAQGSSEPSFTDGEGYRVTLATMGSGELSFYLDLGTVATALAPLAAGLGFDATVDRLVAAFETFGSTANVVRITAEGTESETVQVLRGDAGDLALYRLLSTGEAAPRALLDAVPESAVSLQVTSAHPAAWWEYLVSLVADMPELAVPDLDRLLLDMTGLAPRRDLFGWTGAGTLTVVTGFGATVDPGVPAEDLLGESVLVAVAADEAAAREGLMRFFSNLAATASAFTDPMGQGGPPATRQRDVEGVTVTTFDLFPGASLSLAVTDGLAVIGTTDGGTDATVRAIRTGGALAPTLARLLPEVPADAASFSLSDDRAALEGTIDQLTSQVMLLAGMGGAAALDFDAVLEATDALEAFLTFFAERLGGSVSYSRVDGAVVRTFGRSEVRWR
jgi:hypothetical protein